LLQPLLVPDQAWQTICLDFVEGLPKSNHFDTIMVVVDKFSKYGHFIPLAHPFIAMQVAQAFMDNIYKFHGLPQQIISDRDRIFTSTLWQQLFKLSDMQLLMSSSYHPQTDGQTERPVSGSLPAMQCSCLSQTMAPLVSSCRVLV
jgi:hypothetical protein